MKIIYAPAHCLHNPAREFAPEGCIPYPESPQRAEAIITALRAAGFSDITAPKSEDLEPILAVHRHDYIRYLEHIYAAWVEAGETSEMVVASVFALGIRAQKPQALASQAGYYSYDTTPLVEGTFAAAVEAAHCALAGADLLLAGESVAYALCRPPGHHASSYQYGGYCYLNNAAIAAARLARGDKVAILDIDYHHGNGTQDIFYETGRVCVVSIHADPERAYPFYWGRQQEKGRGAGRGANHNYPLPAGTDDEAYLEVVEQALERIARFEPGFLVVSVGADIYREDPLGDFSVTLDGFGRIGEKLAGTGLPTLLVQEGGYHIDSLGAALVHLLDAYRP